MLGTISRTMSEESTVNTPAAAASETTTTNLVIVSEASLLRHRLFEMGTAAEEMLADTLRALRQQESHQGHQGNVASIAMTVDLRDQEIDRMDEEIEVLCQNLMARPDTPPDELRLISTALKVITDLERIADHAVDIARLVERISKEAFFVSVVDVPRLGEAVCKMLREALDAFLHQDAVLASSVLLQEDAIDALYGQMRRDLSTAMQNDPSIVITASHLLFVTHYLERIADHSTNIAERVNYIQTGDRRL
jgi:phosphate transport system protein